MFEAVDVGCMEWYTWWTCELNAMDQGKDTLPRDEATSTVESDQQSQVGEQLQKMRLMNLGLCNGA